LKRTWASTGYAQACSVRDALGSRQSGSLATSVPNVGGSDICPHDPANGAISLTQVLPTMLRAWMTSGSGLPSGQFAFDGAGARSTWLTRQG